ncbi:MAG: hypothetical protein JJU07_07560 [Natronohydrobacter sp.]|nr:hypothetical protein [Natronohydrobacter sp.]
MGALKDRLTRSVIWRLSEARRHLNDITGSLRYALQRRSGALTVTEGMAQPAARLAVYTLFPQQGIQTSHIHALRALYDCGYATVAVSNLPLTETERARLAPLVWKLIERPNFGYDFGAYREGIRALAPYLGGAHRLVLLNDSVWFPLPGGADWPLQAEGLGVDVAGAVSNYGVPMPEALSLDGFQWRYDPGLPQFHYCSFALSFGPNAIRHPAFDRFWRRIRLTDNKFHTVLRGEVALSRALIDAGLSHAETLKIKTLDARLDALSTRDLYLFVAELAIPEDHRLEALRQRVLAEPEGPGQRARLLSAALGIIALTGPAYVMPAYAHEVLGQPFLKKSPLRLARPAAEATLRLTQRLPGSVGATIHAEALALARARHGDGIGS